MDNQDLNKKNETKHVKRLYVKPAIVEEEVYETCAVLACSLKNPRFCRGVAKHS